MMRTMTNDSGRVAWITIAPVKSMALVALEHARLERTGIAGDRAFAVIDPEGRLVNGKRIGPLATIRPDHDPASGRLTLHLPDGTDVAGVVDLGAAIDASWHGSWPVRSPWENTGSY